MNLVCCGDTLPDQVSASMRLIEALYNCELEDDKVVVLRGKSGFFPGLNGVGGYADVKLLCLSDCGEMTAFDGTTVPLKIIGEVQVILDGYKKVKEKMHLP